MKSKAICICFQIIVLFIIFVVNAHANQSQLLTADEGKFSIEFPLSYHEIIYDKSDPLKKRIFMAGNEEQGVVYSIIFAEVNTEKMSRKQILSAMTQVLTNVSSELSQQNLSSPRYIGKELIMPLRLAIGKGGVFKWYRKQVIVGDAIFYQIELMADSREKLTSEASESFGRLILRRQV